MSMHLARMKQRDAADSETEGKTDLDEDYVGEEE